MHPDVMAKRYSHGTRELAEVDSKNSKELVEKENMQIDEVVENVDAGIDVKTCIWLIVYIYIAMGSNIYTLPKRVTIRHD